MSSSDRKPATARSMDWVTRGSTPELTPTQTIPLPIHELQRDTTFVHKEKDPLALKLFRDQAAKTPTICAYTTRPFAAKTNDDYNKMIAARIADPADLPKKLHGLALWSRARSVSGYVTLVTVDGDGVQTKSTLRTATMPVPNMKEFPTFPARVCRDTLALASNADPALKFISFGFSLHDAKPKPKDDADTPAM